MPAKTQLLLILGLLLVLACQNGNKKLIESNQPDFIFENPPFKECHASTIVELSPGKFMAAWFAGTREKHPDVTIWYSTLEAGHWSPIEEIATGVINDTLRYPCWNPVLFKAQEGKLFLFYKVGPSPREWWGEMRYSMDLGESWSAPQKLPENILGPIKNKPIQLPGGTILCPSSTEYEGADWKVHIEKTDDLGKTWTKIPIDQETPYHPIQPSILNHGEGTLQILCRSKEGKVLESWSKDNGNTWSEVAITNLPNPSAGTDAITLKDGRHLIVYNPTVRTKQSNGRQKLYIAESKDGIHWKDIHKLEDQPTGEFSYPAIIQASDGSIHITYTWKRKKIKYLNLNI